MVTVLTVAIHQTAPLVNSSDGGPTTRLSVDTSDHRDVRTVTWNHGYDGLWSESHVSFVSLPVEGRCLPVHLSHGCLPVHLSHRCLSVNLSHRCLPASSPCSQVFTNSSFSQEAPSPVEHTPSAISIETLWTQSTALASSSSSLQQQANTATSTTSNIIC